MKMLIRTGIVPVMFFSSALAGEQISDHLNYRDCGGNPYTVKWNQRGKETFLVGPRGQPGKPTDHFTYQDHKAECYAALWLAKDSRFQHEKGGPGGEPHRRAFIAYIEDGKKWWAFRDAAGFRHTDIAPPDPDEPTTAGQTSPPAAKPAEQDDPNTDIPPGPNKP